MYFVKLRSLEAFCAAVEEGSISGAARRMYLTQPSVSERLAELEREAGVPLLVRSRRGVSPTARGEALYAMALQVLEGVREIEGTLREFRAEQDGDDGARVPNSDPSHPDA